MPCQLDLTGRRFGKLVVLRRQGKMRWGRMVAAWRCRCDCGTELRVAQIRLPHRASIPRGHVVDACPRCRTKPCKVCGRPIRVSGHMSAACSRACRAALTRRIQREAKRRAYADPVWRERTKAMARARRLDPAKAERIRARDRGIHRRKSARAKRDPEYAARRKAQVAATYRRHRKEVQARRRAKLDAMTPEQRADWCERMRIYGRRYAEKRRAKLAANPAQLQKHRDTMREYRRQRALLDLVLVADDLTRRLDR